MYKVVQGREVNGDDPSDPQKIPKTADDLHHPIYPLRLRMTRLDELAKARLLLQDLETTLVFSPSTTKSNLAEETRRKVQNLREKIKMIDLRAPCETSKCLAGNPPVFIFLNRCSTCYREKDPSTPAEIAEFDLLCLRNLIQRLTFLEEKISSSLSNQLTLEELENFLEESRHLVSFIH